MNGNVAALVDVSFDKDARTFHEKIMELISEAANTRDILNMKYIDLQHKLEFLQDLDEQVQNLRDKLMELEKIAEAPVMAITAKDMEDNATSLQVCLYDVVTSQMTVSLG